MPLQIAVHFTNKRPLSLSKALLLFIIENSLISVHDGNPA